MLLDIEWFVSVLTRVEFVIESFKLIRISNPLIDRPMQVNHGMFMDNGG